jgi:Flp pilus assembly protein TadG
MKRAFSCCPRRRSAPRRRCGAVLVEFALCAPLLFFFFFSALEFARVNMIRQSIENAVYEGSRRGIVPGATADDCRQAAQVILNSVSINSAQIDVNPTNITTDTPEVTVSIAVPVNSNSWVVPFFFKNKTISGTMTLTRERISASSVP